MDIPANAESCRPGCLLAGGLPLITGHSSSSPAAGCA